MLLLSSVYSSSVDQKLGDSLSVLRVDGSSLFTGLQRCDEMNLPYVYNCWIPYIRVDLRRTPAIPRPGLFNNE